MSFLLQCKSINLNVRNHAGVSCLSKAVSQNDTLLVQWLLEANAASNAISTMNTNLIYEAAFGASAHSLDLIKTFEKRGVDCNHISADGMIPLMVAVIRKCPSTAIEYLLSKAESAGLLTIKNICGQSLIFNAFERGDFQLMVRIAEKLIAQGKPWGELPDVYRFKGNQLVQAVEEDSISQVRNLLQKESNFVDVDQREELLGRTPLHLAVLRGRLEIVRLLLEANANPYRQDRYGRIPRELLPFEKSDDDLKIEMELKNHELRQNENDYR